jgi:hypothetical protein
MAERTYGKLMGSVEMDVNAKVGLVERIERGRKRVSESEEQRRSARKPLPGYCAQNVPIGMEHDASERNRT